MIAGKLTDKITLQRYTSVVDTFGATQTVYTTTESVKAEVKWSKGGMHNEASEVFADVSMEFIIYAAHNVGPYWRVLYDGMVFKVTAVQKTRAKNMKRLICERVNE